MNIDKKQIKEVLECLRDYSDWMYNSPEAIEMFRNRVFNVDQHKLKLDVLESGDISITLVDTGVTGIYKPYIYTKPAEKNTLDNLCYAISLYNESELSPENVELFKKLGVIALSYFQRANAFLFFARMQEETISMIAESLDKILNPVSVVGAEVKEKNE